MNELTVGSLFSGIGGFDLGLERAGMRVLWQCEIDPYCEQVLARHWPDVLRVRDIRRVIAASRGIAPGDCVCEGLDYVPAVDVLAGGFPCQDISVAGRGAGIDGERSGLWSEMLRLVSELRPRYVVVENVAALLARGMGRVLGDLAACGYDAEWDCIPASAVGAPHRRDRLWLVAYPQSAGLEGLGADAGEPQEPAPRDGRALGDPEGNGRGSRRQGRSVAAGAGQPESERAFQMADAAWDAAAGGGPETGPVGERARASGQRSGAHPDADSRGRQECQERDGGPHGPGLEAPFGDDPDGLRDAVGGLVEPGLGRGLDGVSAWLDGSWEHGAPRVTTRGPSHNARLRSLGNALVPQIAEWIGWRIIESEEEMRLVA